MLRSIDARMHLISLLSHVPCLVNLVQIIDVNQYAQPRLEYLFHASSVILNAGGEICCIQSGWLMAASGTGMTKGSLAFCL